MRSLVVAPHPDDEVLGCGGTLLRRRTEGHETGWLIISDISESQGWSSATVKERAGEIDQVAEIFQFKEVFNLKLPDSELDRVPKIEMVRRIADVFKEFEPEEVFLPHPADIHTDHRAVFEAGAACTKWFRYPFVKRVLVYETISETDFSLDPGSRFQPNVFVDISSFLDAKVEAMRVYRSEVGEFPFPRSVEAICAQATLRGAASGCVAAEAFELLKERE